MRRFFLPLLISCAAVLAGTFLFAQATPAKSGCPPEGDATKVKMKRLNEARARLDDVTDDDVDDSVSMEEICEPGDDRLRWQDGQGVEVTAYVIEVRDGGPSSSNCHSARSSDHDTILELAPSAGADAAHRFYAVVTPQWRQAVSADHVDWSTAGLRAHYVQRWVTVRGWLLFNPDAASSSLHTTELMGPGVSRMSAWEIHPVTSLDLEEDVLDQQARVNGAGVGDYAKSNTSSSAPPPAPASPPAPAR